MLVSAFFSTNDMMVSGSQPQEAVSGGYAQCYEVSFVESSFLTHYLYSKLVEIGKFWPNMDNLMQIQLFTEKRRTILFFENCKVCPENGCKNTNWECDTNTP